MKLSISLPSPFNRLLSARFRSRLARQRFQHRRLYGVYKAAARRGSNELLQYGRDLFSAAGRSLCAIRGGFRGLRVCRLRQFQRHTSPNVAFARSATAVRAIYRRFVEVVNLHVAGSISKRSLCDGIKGVAGFDGIGARRVFLCASA